MTKLIGDEMTKAEAKQLSTQMEQNWGKPRLNVPAMLKKKQVYLTDFTEGPTKQICFFYTFSIGNEEPKPRPYKEFSLKGV
jgi:hypothetical protein